MSFKKWQVKPLDFTRQQILAHELNISPVTAQLLLNRGILTCDEAYLFLNSDLNQLHDPFLLFGMDKAVERILFACAHQEKILVYGDYDVDGITSTVLLMSVLKKIGAKVSYYLPNRLKDGYGVNRQAILAAKADEVKLVITVDCGISAYDIVAEANTSGGPEIIITDHHQLPETLPPATAVINPKRAGYPFCDLAGVGVAFKLAQALFSRQTSGIKHEGTIKSLDVSHQSSKDLLMSDDRRLTTELVSYLDLVCLGTIADVVPLTGENRVFVKYGLLQLAKTKRPGLLALFEVCGLNQQKQLDVEKVSFTLVPRLNAAGRMNDASLSVALLTSEDLTQALDLAKELNKKNQERQAIESKIYHEALNMLKAQFPIPNSQFPEKVIVLDAPNWHLGVVGIVASRLAELFYRPVFLINRDFDLGKGSARSIPGFDLYAALKNVRQYLTSFGGHVGAAGFSLPVTQIENFRQAMQNYAATTLAEEDLTPELECDTVISLRDVSLETIREIEKLAPFGCGNPMPLLVCTEATVLESYAVGKEKKHLRLIIQENGTKRKGIIFNWFAHETSSDMFQAFPKVAFAFTPHRNEWNNQLQAQLHIKDFKSDFAVAHPISKYNPKNARKHLFFLPEFVHQKIRTYKNSMKKNNQQVFSLTSSPVSSELAVTLNTLKEKNSLTFVDWRQQINRFDQLAKLLLSSKQTLILVSCPFQTVELAFYLRQLNTLENDKLAFYNICLPYSEKKAVIDLFTAGRLKFLVSTPFFCPPLFLTRKWEQVVIFNLPFHYQSWQEAINIASVGEARAVYLLFGKQDCLVTRKYLETLAPERDCLAKLYLIFLGHKNNVVMKETSFFNQIVKILRAAGLAGVNKFTVQISLRILTELGLINFSKQSENLKIELLPKPAKKLALLDSATFCYTQQLKKEVLAWQEQALTLPVTQLLNAFKK